MPIRPENLKKYPPDWPAISRRIRFERAEGRCECCGECGTDHSKELYVPLPPYERCQAIHGCPHPITGSDVVLTVAHLDHAPENCGDDNLKAMCQRCHNRYDGPHRRRGIAERRRKPWAVKDLFQTAGGEA